MSDFISLWLVLVNYNRILHFVFLPWRVIFITFQPFLWSVIKIKQSGIRNSEEVSHILKTNYITFTCDYLNQIPNNQYILQCYFSHSWIGIVDIGNRLYQLGSTGAMQQKLCRFPITSISFNKVMKNRSAYDNRALIFLLMIFTIIS